MFTSLSDLVVRRFVGVVRSTSGIDVPVRVERGDDLSGNGAKWLALSGFRERGTVVGGELPVKTRETRGDGAEDVWLAISEGDQLE
jgi:hypothetical protein